VLQITTPPRSDSKTDTWISVYGPAVSLLSLGTLGFFYVLALFSALCLAGRELDLAVFLSCVLVLPLVCGTIYADLLRPSAKSWGPVAESINVWTVVLALIALTAVSLTKRLLAAGPAFWTTSASTVVLATLGIHVLAIASLLWWQLGSTGCRQVPKWAVEFARSAALQISMLAAVFFITVVALFRLEPGRFQLKRYPLLAGFDSSFALIGACALLAAATLLFRLEASLERRNQRALARIRRMTLLAATVLTCGLYFDFLFHSDPLHYLTNIGPALHLLHGGILMVDTFSQYGPGPVVATLLGFRIAPISFGTANVVVQLFNLAFYIGFLACLYRMTSRKLPALLLGLFAIGFMWALWAWGEWSLNGAPSVLGFRYLPPLLMVLALSLMQAPNRWSFFTAFATFFAGLWSLEALVGTLAIHLLFLLMEDLRERAYRRLPFDALTAILPAGAAILVMIGATEVWAKSLPDFGGYLGFFKHYNALSSYWGIAADGLFWGWVPLLLAYFLVMAAAWLRVVDPKNRLLPLDDHQLFHRYVPMAGLLAITGAYYASRAVDFTVASALLPFCAIAIPAGLDMASLYQVKRWPGIIIASIPILAVLWAFTHSLFVLYSTGPRYYSFAIHECRDKGHCTPRSLAHTAQERLRHRLWLEQPGADRRGIVKQAVDLSEHWAADREKLVMLDPGAPSLTAFMNDVALMHGGKWHLWPLSLTFSDELNAVLREKILASPVKLTDGDVVIIRKDEEALGPLEKGILQKVRSSSTLCTLPGEATDVAAYRVSLTGAC
jgi:hypothetical protein